MKRKTALSLFLTMVAFATCVSAQNGSATHAESLTPAKRALILELLEVTGATQTAKSIAESFDAQIDSNTRKTLDELRADTGVPENTDREREESATRMKARIRELFKQRIDFGRILEDVMLEVYGKRFSEEELREVLTFSKSPTGQKMNREAPQLFTETIKLVSDKVQPVMTEVAKQVIGEEEKLTERSEKQTPQSKRKAPKTY